ncbi:hypothetical protein Pint_27306 [Pistacia integerrima]|uniref:Uncharacterized protein n=1 Tax=Pistacia integerrima TaxID=434235 RepID=A0ACC0YUB9_9ROSI|nr:hypothetical protein Pint_27306 [Pistacia integerrima]
MIFIPAIEFQDFFHTFFHLLILISVADDFSLKCYFGKEGRLGGHYGAGKEGVRVHEVVGLCGSGKG